MKRIAMFAAAAVIALGAGTVSASAACNRDADTETALGAGSGALVGGLASHSIVGAVVGEFVGSNSGLGFVLQRSIGNFELPTMFAALVVLSLIGVILFWVLDLIERFAIPWHASQRQDFIVAV